MEVMSQESKKGPDFWLDEDCMESKDSGKPIVLLEWTGLRFFDFDCLDRRD